MQTRREASGDRLNNLAVHARLTNCIPSACNCTSHCQGHEQLSSRATTGPKHTRASVVLFWITKASRYLVCSRYSLDLIKYKLSDEYQAVVPSLKRERISRLTINFSATWSLTMPKSPTRDFGRDSNRQLWRK